MRSCLVKVVSIGSQDPLELLLLQDEQVIKTLATHTAQKPLTDGIGTWCVIGRFEYLDVTRLSNPREGHAKLAIVISDEVLRSHPIGGGFSKLLGGPNIRRRVCHADVDHLP